VAAADQIEDQAARIVKLEDKVKDLAEERAEMLTK